MGYLGLLGRTLSFSLIFLFALCFVSCRGKSLAILDNDLGSGFPGNFEQTIPSSSGVDLASLTSRDPSGILETTASASNSSSPVLFQSVLASLPVPQLPSIRPLGLSDRFAVPGGTVSIGIAPPAGGNISVTGTLLSKAQRLDRDLALYETDAPYGQNWFYRNNHSSVAIEERWIKGNENGGGVVWYYISPEGNLFRWNRSDTLADDVFIAQLHPRYYDDPSLLFNAHDDARASALTSASPNQLNFHVSGNFAGTIEVSLNVTNGVQSRSADFKIVVSNQPEGYALVPLAVSVPGAEIVGRVVDVAVESRASSLQASLGLSLNASLVEVNDYSLDWFYRVGHVSVPLREKWVKASNGWVYIVADGNRANVYRWDSNNVSSNPLLATLHRRYYDNPLLLGDAEAQFFRPAVAVGANRVHLLPARLFQGNLELDVTAVLPNGAPAVRRIEATY